MIEVEVKLPLQNHGDVEKELVRLGFTALDLVRERDIYYTSDFHDFMKTDEALRIRSCENITRGTASAFITYKGPKIDAVSMTRKELETGIFDMTAMHEILQALGYREVIPVKKLRQYYHRDMEIQADHKRIPLSVHACFDQVEDLGAFLELEILVEGEEDRQTALYVIEGILHELGYSLADTTRYSYLFMLQENIH